jgi:phosphoribosyl 1,2-cyclic phosphate phosphodiesterase
MDGELTFLGTGTSMGVPTLGCACDVCTSADPRDRRLRPSVLLRWNDAGCERTIIIDTGPDFREQALRHRIVHIDAVLYTHSHADHILGMDDLRPLSFIAFQRSGPIPLYVTAETDRVLRRIYDYTFAPDSTYPTRAKVTLEPIGDQTRILGIDFVRVPVLHGKLEIAGYRFGNTAYLTDVSGIPEESYPLLAGVENLVISALRHHPHPSHATVEQALGWSARIGARHTWFTHIAHELGHEQTNRMLPEGVQLAYDGLTIPIRLA